MYGLRGTILVSGLNKNLGMTIQNAAALSLGAHPLRLVYADLGK